MQVSKAEAKKFFSLAAKTFPRDDMYIWELASGGKQEPEEWTEQDEEDAVIKAGGILPRRRTRLSEY